MFFSKTEKKILILIAGLLALGALSQYLGIRKIITFKMSDHGLIKEVDVSSSQPSSPAGQKAITAGFSENAKVKPKPKKAPISAAVKFPINLNTATEIQLMRIKGVGPKTAKAIVAYRDSLGSFTDISHLVRVKGIGAKKLEKISPYLCL